MAHTTKKTEVRGVEEQQIEEVKRTRPFLFIFEPKWWEVVKTTSYSNDIYIDTDRPIRHVYLNGEIIK